MKKYQTFAEFYPYYLSEHANATCRRLHFVGSVFSLYCLVMTVTTLNFSWLIAALLVGYGCAWVGHFFFEHNKPATFQYPLYSFMGDWKMFWELLTRKIAF